MALWREIREWLDAAYPDAVMVPEGVSLEPVHHSPSTPTSSSSFMTRTPASSTTTARARCHSTSRGNHSSTPKGEAAPGAFLDAWDGAVRRTRRGLSSWPPPTTTSTGCAAARGPEQLGAALTFLFTWGSVPCLYYGDEIGMRYLPALPDVEGSVCNPSYNRAGCRTPMQWDDSLNTGFSTADPSRLYLPIDPDPDRPTVAAQQADPASTLALVRDWSGYAGQRLPSRTRRARVVHEDYPFAYVRGETHLVVVNPRRGPPPSTPATRRHHGTARRRCRDHRRHRARGRIRIRHLRAIGWLRSGSAIPTAP